MSFTILKYVFKILLIHSNFRSNEQKADAIVTWDSLKESKSLAEKAVEDGDNTLKKAKHTYELLQKFSEEVEKSSETAKVALENVPEIEDKVRETERLIGDAESVSSFVRKCLHYFLL